MTTELRMIEIELRHHRARLLAHPSAEPLTPRQAELAKLIASGLTNKECAWRMGIAIKTAESHRARLMDAIGAHSPQDVTRWAIRRGLVEP